MTMIRRKRPYSLWAVLVATALVTASCATRTEGRSATTTSHTAPAPGRSRTTLERSGGATTLVFGIIRLNPTCPVDPVRHVCRPHPLGHVEVRALAPAARLAASAVTQANGHFSLRLKPGSYVLVVVVAGPFPRCPRQPVSIRSASAVRADITCDTGIRVPANGLGS